MKMNSIEELFKKIEIYKKANPKFDKSMCLFDEAMELINKAYGGYSRPKTYTSKTTKFKKLSSFY